MDEADSAENLLEIEVAHAKPDEQVVLKLAVPQDTTLEQAVRKSGLLDRFPEINAAELKVGVFGVLCKPEQSVKQGDRVEIYRPLLNDPKAARRQRALLKQK